MRMFSINDLIIPKEDPKDFSSFPTLKSSPKGEKNIAKQKELEEGETKEQSEPSIYDKEYYEVVEITLKNSGNIGKELSFRKDVVNKIILRLFRKSISKLFTMRVKKPSRSNKTADQIKSKLLDKAYKLGLLD